MMAKLSANAKSSLQYMKHIPAKYISFLESKHWFWDTCKFAHKRSCVPFTHFPSMVTSYKTIVNITVGILTIHFYIKKWNLKIILRFGITNVRFKYTSLKTCKDISANDIFPVLYPLLLPSVCDPVSLDTPSVYRSRAFCIPLLL